ncbi:hypothetical protein JCM8547_004228 [Rhodosporidiobolus lusitaniae]
MLRLIALPALASLAAAQYRFPCTIFGPSGEVQGPDNTQCWTSELVAPGANEDGTGAQGNGVTPVNPVCTLDASSGEYFCGAKGAACSSDANCDNGTCQGGVCTGFFGDACNGDDAQCLGYLYCTNAGALPTAADTCGARGAFCQDPVQGSQEPDPYAAFNRVCSTGYCNALTAQCDDNVPIGGDCSADPDFACQYPAVCDQGVCSDPTSPSTTTTTQAPTTTTTTSAAATTTAPAAGGLGYQCNSDDQQCRQGLYCTGPSYEATPSNTCGGNGAFCADPALVPDGATIDQAQPIFNAACSSGFCNPSTGACDVNPTTSAGQTTAQPSASTPFVVSGSVSTTKPIEMPAPTVLDVATCGAIYGANLANCDEIGNAYYPCSSTSSADVEECCETIFAAYFGAGGGEDEAQIGAQGLCWLEEDLEPPEQASSCPSSRLFRPFSLPFLLRSSVSLLNKADTVSFTTSDDPPQSLAVTKAALYGSKVFRDMLDIGRRLYPLFEILEGKSDGLEMDKWPVEAWESLARLADKYDAGEPR